MMKPARLFFLAPLLLAVLLSASAPPNRLNFPSFPSFPDIDLPTLPSPDDIQDSLEDLLDSLPDLTSAIDSVLSANTSALHDPKFPFHDRCPVPPGAYAPLDFPALLASAESSQNTSANLKATLRAAAAEAAANCPASAPPLNVAGDKNCTGVREIDVAELGCSGGCLSGSGTLKFGEGPRGVYELVKDVSDVCLAGEVSAWELLGLRRRRRGGSSRVVRDAVARHGLRGLKDFQVLALDVNMTCDGSADSAVSVRAVATMAGALVEALGPFGDNLTRSDWRELFALVWDAAKGEGAEAPVLAVGDHILAVRKAPLTVPLLGERPRVMSCVYRRESAVSFDLVVDLVESNDAAPALLDLSAAIADLAGLEPRYIRCEKSEDAASKRAVKLSATRQAAPVRYTFSVAGAPGRAFTQEPDMSAAAVKGALEGVAGVEEVVTAEVDEDSVAMEEVEEAAPEEAAPEDAAPEDAAPEDAAPEDVGQPGDEEEGENDGVNVGAIVGGVVAGVAGLAMVAAAVVIVKRRKEGGESVGTVDERKAVEEKDVEAHDVDEV